FIYVNRVPLRDSLQRKPAQSISESGSVVDPAGAPLEPTPGGLQFPVPPLAAPARLIEFAADCQVSAHPRDKPRPIMGEHRLRILALGHRSDHGRPKDRFPRSM